MSTDLIKLSRIKFYKNSALLDMLYVARQTLQQYIKTIQAFKPSGCHNKATCLRIIRAHLIFLYLNYFCSCLLQNVCNLTPQLNHFNRHPWAVILLWYSNSYFSDVYILTQIQCNKIIFYCSRVQWIMTSKNI